MTMPSYTSLERRVTMRAFGADLVVTDPTKGMGGTVKKAYELLESTPNAFMLQQFANPANTQVTKPFVSLFSYADYQSRFPEILLYGLVDLGVYSCPSVRFISLLFQEHS